ncbi:MAG TPA: hypothetical protein VNG93_04080 [Candidatus Dormibacteraeota bacterium]|nr:hypothetical protein [Candidatus Dormibacteraeota bacterium]
MEARLPRRFPYLPELDGVWLRLILTLMVLIASASLLTGTAATLNSTTVNPGSSFTAGTLVLSNQVANRNPCLSQGPRVSCDALFPGVLLPGVPAMARVTITNLGTLPVTTLGLWSTSCANVSGSGSNRGTGDVCASTWLTIHDDNHDQCYFPVKAPGACTTAMHATFDDFVKAFNGTRPMALSTDHLGGGNAYTLTATIDPAAANDIQNRAGNIDFIWEITQG